MNQLAFDISLPPNYAEEDFLVSECNQAAWSALEQWDKEAAPCMLLKGPKASGKTHLASIWAQRNQAKSIEASSLTDSDPGNLFQASNTIVIENCEHAASDDILFHLLNFMRNNTQQRLLLTVDSAACWEGFALPDLRSRLQALPQAQINEPDDALLNALLVKSFHDRQVEISQTSLDYLLPRIERSFDGMKHIIESLDKHAIAKKRPITRSLIQEVLTKS